MGKVAGEPRSVLTIEDARLIKALVHERERCKQIVKNLSNEAIAEKFDISHKTVESISNGRTWRNA